jgi:hypothetical protein
METKKFDAVQFMRQVRDKMGEDMRGMSFEEQRAYIERHASKLREDLAARESETGLQASHPRQAPPAPPR